MSLTLFLLACTGGQTSHADTEGHGGGEDTSVDSPVDSAADSAEDTGRDTSGSATDPRLDEALDPTFEQVGVGGVVRVTWTTSAPADGVVYFGEAEPEHAQAAVDSADGLLHTALVVGLAAGIPWNLRAESRAGDELASSETVAITPPSPPASLPVIAVSTVDPAIDGLVLTSDTNITGTVALLDRKGRYVWWRASTVGSSVLPVALSADGTAIEWLEDPEDDAVDSTFVREALDGSSSQTFAVPYGHHAFVAVPEGGWAFVESDVRTRNGREVVGDRIVEYDASGNAVREVWSAWNDYSPTGLDSDDPSGEWTHANSLQYVPERDAYLVTLLLFEAVILIDRTTGSVVWQLGGDDSDFQFGQEFDREFDRIHGARLLEDGHVLLFDNGESDEGSSVVEFALDESAMTAEEIWRYTPSPMVYAHVRGNVERQADGDTFIAWGSAGSMSEIGADGALRWEATMLNGATPGFSIVLPSLGGSRL